MVGYLLVLFCYVILYYIWCVIVFWCYFGLSLSFIMFVFCFFLLPTLHNDYNLAAGTVTTSRKAACSSTPLAAAQCNGLPPLVLQAMYINWLLCEGDIDTYITRSKIFLVFVSFPTLDSRRKEPKSRMRLHPTGCCPM